MATTAAPQAAASQGPPNHAAATPAGASTSEDATRAPRSDQSLRSCCAAPECASGGGIGRCSAVAPAAAPVFLDGLFEGALVEIGPEHVHEDEFGIGGLPEHEI